jgi:aspartyl-tRNA(Asn)/glutamyl-tRNA(Gln) amidotransferase subunit B
VQETRLYDADRDETRSMRSKEVANDYRYFPEPDLLPVVIDEAFIEPIRERLPELPTQRCERFVRGLRLSEYDAGVLTDERAIADYFEASPRLRRRQARRQLGQGELLAALNAADLSIADSPVSAAQLAGVIARIRTRPSPARSPSRCSRPCGRARATRTRSSRRAA